MAEHGDLSSHALRGKLVYMIDDAGRLAIRASNDVDELISFRARLRTASAGRGIWLLWTWLLLLAGVTFTGVGGVVAYALLAAFVIAFLMIITYVSRTRTRANNASDWLSEVDFRLAQLAARPDSRDPSRP